MKEITSKEEYEALCDEIWHHNRRYFQEAKPIISDNQYDMLIVLLEKIEKRHPDWVSATSPTKRVGEAPLENFSEITHQKPMLSLEKAFKPQELTAFYTRLEKLVDRKNPDMFSQLKMDGLAVSVTYEKGQFIRAVTRGDGKIGSDISSSCRTIRNLPLRIVSKFDLIELRGEIFMPKKRFEEINLQRAQQNLPLFANPRNAASGFLKLLDTKELSKRAGLEIVFYGVIQQLPHQISFQSETDDLLMSLGLPTFANMPYVLPQITQRISSVSEMLDFQEKIHKIRHTLPFQIDGVVFKLDSLDESQSIAPTNKHPRTDIAWKFSAEQVWTIVHNISIQVGRTGVVTPTAELEPVELDGTIVRRATLHNFEEIRRKDIRLKDRVLIEKGGDIIPKVLMSDTTSFERENPVSFPTYCPSCEAFLIKDEEEVHLRCPNIYGCIEQQIKQLIHFVGKDGLDIEHVGEKLIRQLYSRLFIKVPSDLFVLTHKELLSLEGIKGKSAKNILEGIEKAKCPTFDRFIMALGIRHIGTKAAQVIAKATKTIPSFLQIQESDLNKLDGFGDKTTKAIVDCIHSEFMQKEIKMLQSVGVCPVEEDALLQKSYNPHHPFFEKIIVLTGTLQSMTRTAAVKAIEACGGILSESVTKKTAYVVVGNSAGIKKDKAQKLKVPLLDENEFIIFLQP